VAHAPCGRGAGSRELSGLIRRHRLDSAVASSLGCLADALAEDPRAPTTVRDPARIVDDHLADSLVALELEAVRTASTSADLGAGAGLPGLPLAVALPRSRWSLVESSGRKCAFLASLIGRCAIANAEAVHTRVESWDAGLGRFDLVTARALAALPVVLEYAAPLLVVGGTLVAWRGRRDGADETAAERAARELGMEPGKIHRVRPYPEAEHRHLHVWSKVMNTSPRFPRRPGMAQKRPLGGGARL
jgi:16S rRNA (guanine527-N7)-methyltransferase